MQTRKIGLSILFLILTIHLFGQLPGYYFYKTLTIQSSQVQGPGNHTNFPVLIKHTDFDIRHTTSLGDVQNINGWDIRFTAADGTTLLDHQLEYYNPTTGEIVAWVKVPSVSSTVNTDIRMYYGNSSISVNPSTTATWNSRFKGVWHLHNDILDGTSNAHNMTNAGTTNQTACIAADGQDFATGQSLTRALDPTLQFTGDLTLEGWVRLATFQGGTYDNVMFACGGGSETAANNFNYYLSVDGTGRIRTYWESGAGVDNASTSSVVSTIAVNVWMHLTVVRNVATNSLLFYTNGTQLGTPVAFTNDPSGGTNSVFRIGQDPFTAARDMRGDLDELRISDTLRSPGWIRTNYNSMFSPSTFYVIGPEFNACAIAPTTSNAGPDQAVCALNATLAGNIPTYGTGLWTVVTGGATLTTPTSPTSGVTGLSVGVNTFRWTISNGIPCTPSTDEVTIVRDDVPTTSAAGPDQSICATAVATLAGNAPTTGTGLWTVIAGAGTVTTPSSPTSGVTGLSPGVNTFRWTISNGSCTASTDDITITRYLIPSISSAGPDQTICSANTTLAGNNPAIGTGAWSVITGGATVTTPTSPTSGVTGLSIGTNTFRWTISNGVCSPSTDDVTIIRDPNPTVSDAGPDQTICASTSTLAGITPVVGTGVWTVITGAGTVTTPTSPNSGVTGLSIGTNTFRWTISNGTCLPSTDDITINVDQPPTVSAAGVDQTVCATTATLAGNTPVIGIRTWTVIAGSGTVTTPTSPTSGVTGLSLGVNTFRWTISNGTCPPSSDDITITRIDFPTPSAAGPDQVLCTTTATLAGNSPTVGTGAWTVIAGGATVTTPTSPTSGATGLTVGANTFRWTVSNGICTPSTDDITITLEALPTPSNAGPDQSRCASNATLAGNAPIVGTGLWTIIAGGGTITTPTSPTSSVTGLAVGATTLRWTISNGTCPSSSDDIIITRYLNPSASLAGPDQNVCATTATLAGNSPAIGTGLWTVIAGGATITTPTSPTSGVTGLTVGVNTFRWTISNGTCVSTFDNITINRTNFPTVSVAGPDQTLCSTSATLAGNTPTVGTGAWTVITGGATITTPTSPTSGVTGLSVGVNTFRWTISNGICTPSTDDITIIRDDIPTISSAGPDQNICDTTATLAGNTPIVGTGLWTVISGGATITTPTSPTSGITGLTVGINTFRWTISNGTCTPSIDDITITRTDFPTISSAGIDQAVCDTSAILAGNTPTVGSGVWTVITGTATITTATSPNSSVTGLSVGINTFRWTISNGICPSSSDDITIIRTDFPTVSSAGPDQIICTSTATLNANTPAVGTAIWTVVSGTGVLTTPTSPSSVVTGLSIGQNTLVWTISNGICPNSTDTMDIYVDPLPTIANAGMDSTICSTSSSLDGNVPSIGIGMWTVVTGSATLTSFTSASPGLSGLSIGLNTFAWTITSGSCPSSSDTVNFNVDPPPTSSSAGLDQTICSTSATLAANTPLIGTGLWTVIVGGATITTPASPTSGVTGLTVGTNTFRWTISNGVCAPSSDDITIIRDDVPTVASAGIDQTICASSATLAGNIATIGTGIWTVVSGGAIITTPSSPTSGVTGMSIGVNTFVWTISNGTCTPSSDTVIFNIDPFPTPANAGPNQTLCATSATLAGNTPAIGTGVWTVIAGSATITTPTSPTSGVTGLTVGTNTFRWTISNGVCASSSDDITIIRDDVPTVASAGVDQTFCATTGTLAGNTATVGSGIWTVISGGATITSPTSPTSGVTGLSVGMNTFVWTISNGTCNPSSDTVNFNIDPFPTVASAGSNQNVCATFATLAGNAPLVGTGLWSVITGGATVLSPTSPTSGVTGLTIGANTFRWTISNGTCTPSIDDITITRDAIPTVAAAGINQTVCVTTATLAGNPPLVGTGIWTVISGGGIVTTPSSPTSGVTGLSVGINTFRWTISNGTCPASFDDITINRLDFPTPSAAGPDQTLCATAATLAGNAPTVGTGIWTVITGGATITTPTSPTSGVTGLTVGTNTFRWTISNGVCTPSTDDITIIRDDNPTIASAGVDQTICANSATLAGNIATVGTGVWTVISGGATITTPSSPTSGVTGLTIGINTFRWTISNGTCTPSFDDITINLLNFPTTSNAGTDQTLCASSATLAGNTPIVGTGMWTVITGGATITTPTSPTSGVTGLTLGTNTFRWTISNGICTPSTDDIIIIRDDVPTTSSAGVDQTICATSATLAGNSPLVGTGIWTVIAGGATITTPSSPTSGVTGLTVGVNTFRWTISNGTCPPSFDEITINRLNFPTTSNAGTNQTLCATVATLAGNTPLVGTGIWTVITGGATVTTPTSPTSGVTGLTLGTNTFRWTISNGVCTPSTDDVSIIRDDAPTPSVAGLNQTICATTSTLTGNTPTVGTGLWTVVSGGATITTPASATTGVTGLTVGTNTFRWTISNGTCPPSNDDVSIIRQDFPTVANAGIDSIVCSSSSSLNGNNPIVGTGTWTTISGTGTITSPSSPTSSITGMGVGTNIFLWTISNGVCTPSYDTVVYTVNPTTTPASAGSDSNICSSSLILNGNTPTIGTGLWTVVSGSGTLTSPTSPNSSVTGMSIGVNTFAWTITSGSCPISTDTVNFIVDPTPTSSAAGPDQTLCATSATLAGNTPLVGTGLWTVIAGGGTITTSTSPSSGVTGLTIGVNTFRWTISNGSCTSSTDDITITVDDIPTVAAADLDQTFCTSSATLDGNIAIIGTGLWTVVSGGATVTTPSSPTSGVTGMSVGANTFVWTISNGTCPSSSDTVIFNIDAFPTTSAAGPNQTICATSSTLSGNTPIIGTGIWSIIAGGATITTPTSPTSAVTGLTIGANTFRWTISNGVCTPSTDDITIIVDETPTIASADLDQIFCSPSATLDGNIALVGTGLWTVISGSAIVTTPSSPTSGVTGMSVGANTFVWTISNGTCSSSSDTVIFNIDAFPTLSSAGPDQTICVSSSTLAGNNPLVGTGMWTVISGSATITTPTSPTSGVTGLTIGVNTFRWTISNGTCAPSTDDITITVDQIPTAATAGPDQTICVASATLTGNAPTTGTGLWTVISGSATITTPSSPTSGVTGMSVGANTFVWTISNGTCPSSSDTIIFNIDAFPSISAAGPDQTICVSSSTLAGNNPIVGTGIWTVVSGSATITTPTSPTSGVTGLTLGANTFRWTISNGTCAPSMDDITITVDQIPTIATAGLDQTICATSATLTGNIAGIGTGMWTIISGSATTTTPSSPTSGVTGMSVGANTFVWTISNGSCPSSSDTVMFNVDAFPTISAAGPDQTICDTNATLAGNTPLAGTGLWTVISGGASVTSPTSPTSGVTGLTVGANTFRWTISNGTCASSTDDITIVRDQTPTIAVAGLDQTFCAPTGTLAGNVATIGTGIWTIVSGTGTITAPTSPTSGITGMGVGVNTFVWTISNGTCTASFDSVNFNINPFPTTADAGSDSTICSASSTLNGNTPVLGTGLWTVVSGTGTLTTPTSPNTSITGMSVGINTFVWTITSGSCPPTTDTVIYTLDSIPTFANAGIDSTVCFSSSSLNGNTPTVGTGVWTVITGGGIITTPTSPNSGITGMSVGVNTFVWTITNGTCPSSTDTVSFIVNPPTTTSNAGIDSTICSSSASLNGNTPTVGSGIWTVIAGGGIVTTPTSPTSTMTGLSIGANIFVWTITNGTCPATTDTVIITVVPMPSIAFAGVDSTICFSSSSLNGNTPIFGTGTWTVISGSGIITTPTSPSSAVTGMSVGVNTFVWSISNGTCSSTSDTVSYIVNPATTISNAGFDSTICSSSSTLIGNIPTVGTGMWSLVSGSGVITSPTSATTTVTGLGTGANTFQWTITNGTCPPSIDDVVITVDTIPTIANAGADINTNLTSVTLNANSPLIGIGSWSITSGSGSFVNINDPATFVSSLSYGQNILTWTISNGACPSTSDEMIVFVTNLDVPNSFSPNGDNVNDYFEIPGLFEFKLVELDVFNRWGNLVYNNSDYQNNWDGSNNSGSPLSDDTYYYTLKLSSEKTITGFVVIKRK